MNPTAVNLSIDVDALFVEPSDLDGDPVNIRTAMRNAVVAAAAEKLVAGFDADTLHEMRQEVHRVRSELVRERLVAEVTAAMDLPIQRTTRWGDPTGKSTTLRELIREELEEFLAGTRTERKMDSYDKSPHNLRELVNLVARDTMHGELGKSVRAARAEVNKQVQAILVQAIAEKLAPVE